MDCRDFFFFFNVLVFNIYDLLFIKNKNIVIKIKRLQKNDEKSLINLQNLIKTKEKKFNTYDYQRKHLSERRKNFLSFENQDNKTNPKTQENSCFVFPIFFPIQTKYNIINSFPTLITQSNHKILRKLKTCAGLHTKHLIFNPN